MTTPDEPQNPYGSNEPEPEKGPQPPQPPYGAPQPPQYGAPQAPQYGAPQPPQYGAPQAPQYGASPYPSAPQYSGGYAQPAPPNYLVWSILATIFCCLPLGIAAIVFSSQVNSKWVAGDHAGAQESSRKAKLFTIWAVVAGVVVGIIYAILIGLGALSSNNS